MSFSRRSFIKTTAVTGTGIACHGLGLSAFAQPTTDVDEAAVDWSEVSAATANAYTRGIGVYPGSPAEFFGPTLVPASGEHRNLALRRPVYQSSSYDYNHTAQLVTDGIRHTTMPKWIVVSEGKRGVLPREMREFPFDHDDRHVVELAGPEPSLTFAMHGWEQAPEVDRLLFKVVAPAGVAAENMRFVVSTSDDGRQWEVVGETVGVMPASLENYPPDFCAPDRYFTPWIEFHKTVRRSMYRIAITPQSDDAKAKFPESSWRLTQAALYLGDKRVEVGGPYEFTSAWMSSGLDEEWVMVDLGNICRVDRVKLHWIARAAAGTVECSTDGKRWETAARLDGMAGDEDDLRLTQSHSARYVKVQMTRPSQPFGYILSELEVYGTGGLVPIAKPAQLQAGNGSLNLAGGGWRVERASEVKAKAAELSTVGFADSGWLVATVPGTVLTSYLNAGAIPDPNYGDNQFCISDSYFHSDFWYRTEFQVAPLSQNRRSILNFGGINWKAEVFLNGNSLGRIDGGFRRASFDVTELLKPGKNALAVRILKNQTPGSAKQHTLDAVGPNGGALGADNPTFHASAGWDWIPTIRGRNTGVWGAVSLEEVGVARLENPYVWCELPLPDTSSAKVHLEIDAVNLTNAPFRGTLQVQFDQLQVSASVELAANERRTLKLNPTTHRELQLQSPKLWWPVGYGDPHLVDVSFQLLGSATAGSSLQDRKQVKAGLRHVTFSEQGGALRIWINGRRFIGRGGNWGCSESMLRYRSREYDTAVRYHKDMNFTMIRNWVGQIGDDEFWEACDRHGMMVWQDFWLANPWDGPSPDDAKLFLDNARDYVLRVRNHACIGIYCGRNEGYPPEPIESGLRRIIGELHNGMHYIPSSADDVVSGHGPYAAQTPSTYFKIADSKFHSEIGAPNIPNIESVELMMPERDLWPQGLAWGLHDFCLEGAQGLSGFRQTVDHGYGGATSAKDWTRLAQFVNYDTYRAMFEAQSRYRMGIFLWMSHSCWPSFVWQTYDYYFEPTAAYFGCKKGSEPLHIQWNSLTETIEVVNYSAGNHTGLKAELTIHDLAGKVVATHASSLDSNEDTTVIAFQPQYPAGLTPVHFLKLRLLAGDTVVSSNFYHRATNDGDFRALRELPKPKPKLDAHTSRELQGETWKLKTTIKNTGSSVALMVRLIAVREKAGDRILPVMYEDNYIALMPGEERKIGVEVYTSDARGENPVIRVEA